MDNSLLVKQLSEKALEIRKHIVTTCYRTGSGHHMGGALSLCDVGVALYYHFLRWSPEDYRNPDRDRFVLSKGHSGCLFYNIFADMGMYTFDELYSEYNVVGGRFGQHPNRLYLPMFEASTGSLGHGLSLAFGMAMALRQSGSDARVFCVTGDGELNEGSNWEALMSIAHYNLADFILIIDRNYLQGSRHTEDTIRLEPLDKKLQAFGWDTVSFDGNDMSQVVNVLNALPERSPGAVRRPLALISNTLKGKGVDFMEDNFFYHVATLDEQHYLDAIKCLDERGVQ